MLDVLVAEPVVRLIVLPIVGTIVLATALRWIGGASRGEALAGGAAAIVFAWSAAYELGVPLYPPAVDDNGLFYILALALLVGMAIDVWVPEDVPWLRHGETALAFLFGCGVVVWLRATVDVWTVFLLAGWMILALRVRHVADEDTPTAWALLAFVGAGIALAAWSAELDGERGLMLACASAIGGNFLFAWIAGVRRLGTTVLLSVGGMLLILAVRLIEITTSLTPALLILGFVLFADAPARRLLGRRLPRLGWAVPILAALAALLPLGLAALAAYIGVNFEAA